MYGAVSPDEGMAQNCFGAVEEVPVDVGVATREVPPGLAHHSASRCGITHAVRIVPSIIATSSGATWFVSTAFSHARRVASSTRVDSSSIHRLLFR